MRPYKIVLLSLCTLFCISLFGQDKPDILLQTFLGNLSTTIRSHDRQQAYLVTDKSVFRAGETIWFKAFLLNALSQKTYTKSRFLFVDLVNDKDSVVNTIILDAVNKQLNSRFILANTIPAGYYWIRAYTRQMAEENTDGISVQPIYIFSNGYTNLAPKRRIANSPDSIPSITFYPEGNNMITGVNSTIALQVNQKNGEPVITDGYVKDNRDSVIARFTTNANGLGKFAFESSGYRKYKAIINWHGKEISYPLPAFNFYGGQLSVSKQNEGYKLRILLGDSIYRKDAVTYVVGVSRDSLVFASVGRGQYEINVDKQKLTGGINTFYLFDKDFKLLSERSVYEHESDLQIKLATDKEAYAPREKVPLSISITDAKQHAVPSLITISVIDTLLSVADAQNALAGAACSQKAIDNIFFARNENISDESMDLMMLVKSNTYQALNNAVSDSHEDRDSLLYLKGLVLDNKRKPAADKLITLVSKSRDIVSYTDTTDKNGRFRFPLEAYADSTEFMMEVKTLDGKSIDNVIIHDAIVYPKLKTPVCLKEYLPIQNQQVKKYFKTYPSDELIEGDGKSLQPVTVKSTTKTANYDESKRISQNSVILASDKINERSTISNQVQMVGGLQVLNGFLVMLGPPDLLQAIGPQSEPMLIVNGAQVSMESRILQSLDAFNPRDIDFIEILKGPEAAMFGVRGGNGVISVNTRTRPADANSAGSGIKVFYAKGISDAALFPSVGYDKKNKKATTIADNRSTLYWSGNYLTDETHNPALTFYTSDISSAYKVIITGVTRYGDIIYKTMIFQNK